MTCICVCRGWYICINIHLGYLKGGFKSDSCIFITLNHQPTPGFASFFFLLMQCRLPELNFRSWSGCIKISKVFLAMLYLYRVQNLDMSSALWLLARLAFAWLNSGQLHAKHTLYLVLLYAWEIMETNRQLLCMLINHRKSRD